MIKKNVGSVKKVPVVPTAGPKLKGTFDLIGEALKIFGKRWKTLVMIQLIPVISMAALNILAALGQLKETWGEEINESSIILLVTILVLIFPIIFLAMWGNYSMMVAVAKGDDKKKWQDYYKESIKIFWGLFGVGLLAGLFVLGGYILLIIPGIIFAVWYSFSNWAYVEAGKGSGIMNALRESKRIVQGYFWSIVWRSFAVGFSMAVAICIVFAFVGIILAIVGLLAGVGGNEAIWDLMSTILGVPARLVMTSVMMIFMYLLYRNIKDLKAAGIEKKKLSLAIKILAPVAIIFMLLIPIGILSVLAVGALGQARIRARDAVRTSDINQIKTEVEVYKNQKGIYPNALTNMAEIIPVDNFSDPKTGEQYEYMVAEDGSGFMACAELEKGDRYCVTDGTKDMGTTGNTDLTLPDESGQAD